MQITPKTVHSIYMIIFFRQADHETVTATKSCIVVEDDVWLGFGLITLDFVYIDKCAVIDRALWLSRESTRNRLHGRVPAKQVVMRSDVTKDPTK